MAQYELSRPPRRILCIGTPGFGDALLTTPLVRSLKRAYPEAAIDVVVHRGREAMLVGNPDVRRAIPIAKKPGPIRFFTMFGRTIGRYNLSICPMANDRNYWLFRLATRRMICHSGAKRKWSTYKALLANSYHPRDAHRNTVGQMLAFADQLGIERCYEVVPPFDPAAGARLDAAVPFEWRTEPFAVLHATTRNTRKRWTLDGWSAVGARLREEGLRPVMTGGPDEQPDYLHEVETRLGDGTVNLAGRLAFTDIRRLLEEARLYLGVDTSTSHLAAAVGTPTITIFGPGSSIEWAPWPKGYDTDDVPFDGSPGVHRVRNVCVVQAACDCGLRYRYLCGKTMPGRARCLEALPAAPVLEAIDGVRTAEAGPL